MRLPTTPSQFQERPKRYGWHACYDDFVGHPKWRIVARRAQVHLAFVHVVVKALMQTAAKNRQHGYVGNFDFEECEAATDIPAHEVAAVYRTLTDMNWLEQDFIVRWDDRQPNHDPSAAERQRNKRARDGAKHRVEMGIGTGEDLQRLTAEERAASERLLELARIKREAIEARRQEPPLPLPLTAVKGGRVA